MTIETNDIQTAAVLPQGIAPLLEHTQEMNQMLNQDVTIEFFDLSGEHTFKTCYGNLCKTVNALMDYARILELACEQWQLQGYHRALYEYQAEKLREIAGKYGEGIGYDYAAAVEKCRKKQARKSDSDVGEEAMALLVRKNNRAAEKSKKKETKALSQTDEWEPETVDCDDSPWEDIAI